MLQDETLSHKTKPNEETHNNSKSPKSINKPAYMFLRATCKCAFATEVLSIIFMAKANLSRVRQRSSYCVVLAMHCPQDTVIIKANTFKFFPVFMSFQFEMILNFHKIFPKKVITISFCFYPLLILRHLCILSSFSFSHFAFPSGYTHTRTRTHVHHTHRGGRPYLILYIAPMIA